jgi:hypothetical protein
MNVRSCLRARQSAQRADERGPLFGALWLSARRGPGVTLGG